MSFYLVPEKYDFVPDQSDINMALDLLRRILGEAEIEYWESDEAQVVGLLSSGTHKITCPACGKVESFENPAAFGEMLFVQSAETIEFEMPCCGGNVNLAQIDLTANTKFSRFAIEVISKEGLTPSQLESVGNAVKNRLLEVPVANDE